MIFRFERIWSRLQVPLLFVSHDVDAAIILADEILLMGSNGAGVRTTLQNHLPHPRTIEMLNSEEHRQCRQSAIEFLASEGAIRD
jgi:NitT/TauT family transport system ATP-binding protein